METRKVTAIFFILCLSLTGANKEDDCGWGWKDYGYMAAGATAAIVGAPVAVSAAGFGATGVVAGTLAAKGMSLAATYGVGGGAIAGLQSVGAAGLGYFGALVAGAGGAAAGKIVKDTMSSKEDGKK